MKLTIHVPETTPTATLDAALRLLGVQLRRHPQTGELIAGTPPAADPAATIRRAAAITHQPRRWPPARTAQETTA
jgi:hypothetical protein